MFLLVDRHLSSRQGKWSTHDTKVKQRSHPLVHNSSIDDSASSFSGTEDQEEDKSPKGVKHILRNKMAVLDDVGQGRTVTGGSPTSKKRRKPAGAASDLFNKFDSDRKYDPFEDNDPVIRDSKDGMEALLSMCNAVEINSIFGALGFIAPCPRRAKEQQVMQLIRDGGRQVEKKFAEVLKLFWEGLLFEYLRSVGHPLRDTEHDPRHFITRYWRRSMLDPSVRPGFVPFYLKREVKKRNTIMQEDRDIQDIRAGLISREELVKDAELRVRRQHDYRFVLQYFSASRELHRTLVGNVNYLSNEVEQLRANVDHSSESISIMEQQFTELETKYDRVVGGLVHREAFQLTIEGSLYSMVNEGHATVKAAEHIVDRVLAEMAVGPEKYDYVGGAAVDSNTRMETSLEPGGVYSSIGLEDSVATRDFQQKWAEPRLQNRLQDFRASKPTAAGIAMATSQRAANDTSVRGDTSGDSLGLSIQRVQDIHQRACARYINLVAELQALNAERTTAAVDEKILKDKAVANLDVLQDKYDALERRLADAESRSKAEVAAAEDRINEERSRAHTAAALLKGALERVAPTLLDMVTAFVPKDTERLGVDLFEKLEINHDTYAHVLATKQMVKADLESRAFEIIHIHREPATEDATLSEQEEEVTTTGKKKERGRPASRGKRGGGGGGSGGGSADKSGKSGSKSRSKSATGKGNKIPAKKDDMAANEAVGKRKGKPKALKTRKASPVASASDEAESPDRQGATGRATTKPAAKADRATSATKRGVPSATKENRKKK